jgi:hypothetical protein
MGITSIKVSKVCHKNWPIFFQYTLTYERNNNNFH